MLTLTTNLPNTHLKPGHIYMEDKPARISAVLGSCISVTFFNSRQALGAICHSILPEYQNAGPSCISPENFKYVDYSIEAIIDKFKIQGISPDEIDVRLFGGANVFVPEETGSNSISIGKMNIEKALEIISIKGLNMVSLNAGGHSGRKIYFYTHTGEILLTHLEKMEDCELFNNFINQQGT